MSSRSVVLWILVLPLTLCMMSLGLALLPARVLAARGVHTVLQWHATAGSQRVAEYFLALRQTLANRGVASVHILLESCSQARWLKNAVSQVMPVSALGYRQQDGSALVEGASEVDKLHFFCLGRRMNVSDALVYANRRFKGELVAVTNADIGLAEGFDSLKPYMFAALGGAGVVMVPTRWNAPECPNSTRCSCAATSSRFFWCADTFVFRAPLADSLANDPLLHRIEFGGRKGGDNVLLFKLRRHGYTLVNPCLSLRCVHYHCSGTRTYSMNESVANELAAHDPQFWGLAVPPLPRALW